MCIRSVLSVLIAPATLEKKGLIRDSNIYCFVDEMDLFWVPSSRFFPREMMDDVCEGHILL
jgi:hypothetical protein